MKNLKFSTWINLSESEDAFLVTLKANPNDNTTWLVFADWLQEQGDPRVTLIRAVKGKQPMRKGQMNHLGEREYQTYSAWKKAILTLLPGTVFDGNKDIAQALFNGSGVGEWDGEKGSIYDLNNVLLRQFNLV